MSSKHCFFSRARVTINSLHLVLFVCFLAFLSFVSLLRCGSLHARRFGHLNIGSPVDGADREVIGRGSLSGGSTSLELGYESLKPHNTSNSFSASCFQLRM